MLSLSFRRFVRMTIVLNREFFYGRTMNNNSNKDKK